jgi:UDP-glucose 4-epimerase
MSVSVPEDDGAVLVTGICGRLGRRLARVLHRKRRVIGVDLRPFPDRPADVEHHQADLRSTRIRELFRGAGALVHLGVMHDPRRDAGDNLVWNVTAAKHLLECAEHYGLKKVVLLSSANAYGPRPDNPQLLGEDAPLLGAGAFGRCAPSQLCKAFDRGNAPGLGQCKSRPAAGQRTHARTETA